MYYNTTNEKGSELKLSRTKEANQTMLVLEVFKAFPSENFSPDDVAKYIYRAFKKQYPITSVRRAVTELTKEGSLEKTDKKKMGSWGKRVHTWKLKNK